MRPAIVFKVYVYCYLLGCVIAMSMWTSFEQRKVSSSKEFKKNCISTCQLFPALCQNNGTCKESKGNDCQWYCECPAHCKGLFCEKIITNTDGKTPAVVEVVIKKERTVDVASSDRSVLAEALRKLHSMKNSQTDKPPEGPQTIDRIGKTIKVKETVTEKIQCPPDVVDGSKPETVVPKENSVHETRAISSLGENMHNELVSTTDATEPVTSAATTASKTTEKISPVVSSMAIKDQTTKPSVDKVTMAADESVTHSLPASSKTLDSEVKVQNVQYKSEPLQKVEASPSDMTTESTTILPAADLSVTSSSQETITKSDAEIRSVTHQNSTTSMGLSSEGASVPNVKNDQGISTTAQSTSTLDITTGSSVETVPSRAEISTNTEQETTTNFASVQDSGASRTMPEAEKVAQTKGTTKFDDKQSSPKATSEPPIQTTDPPHVVEISSADLTNLKHVFSTTDLTNKPTTKSHSTQMSETTTASISTPFPFSTDHNSLGPSKEIQTTTETHAGLSQKEPENTLTGQAIPEKHHKQVDIFSEEQIHSNQLVESLKRSDLGSPETNIISVYDILSPGLSENAEKKNNLLVDSMMSST